VNFVEIGEAWTFPVDRGLRTKLFGREAFNHPAKLHLGLLQRLIDLYTAPGETLLDPMAGSGSLMLAATQQRHVILRDVQPEYVGLMLASAPRVRYWAGFFAGLIDIDQADAKTLQCPPFEHILMSPPYGFETGSGISAERRLQILQDKKYGRRWAAYLNQLEGCGVSPSVAAGFRYAGGQENIGNKSGRNYWREMQQVYMHLRGIMPSGGRLILVLKNHYRRHQLHDVVGMTVSLVERLGLPLVARHGRVVRPLSLWQRRRLERGEPVVEVEDVLVFEKRRA
jgi:hypothetical protein